LEIFVSIRLPEGAVLMKHEIQDEQL